MLKKFTQFNEAKIFDNFEDLIQNAESYIDNLEKTKPGAWKRQIADIMESESPDSTKVGQLEKFIEDIQQYKRNLDIFLEDTKDHLKEFTQIRKDVEHFSEDAELAEERLDNLYMRVDNTTEFIQQLSDDVNSIIDSYKNIENKLRFIQRFNFKSFL